MRVCNNMLNVNIQWITKSVAIYEEMIELNLMTIRVRDQLLLYLIELSEDKVQEIRKHMVGFMAFPLFNRALFAFKTEGETGNSNKL